MSHESPQTPAPRSTARILLPGIVPTLSFIAPILLLLGWMIFGGTTSRNFFEGSPFQATLGIVVFLTGVMALLTVLVLVGVRSMLQQHLDLAAGTTGGARNDRA